MIAYWSSNKCIKDYIPQRNELFLSKMNIYNQSNLNDHIKYGEYDNKNNNSGIIRWNIKIYLHSVFLPFLS